jgi:hypothetical protein
MRGPCTDQCLLIGNVVRFEVFTAVIMKNGVFLVMLFLNSEECYRDFMPDFL